MYILVGTEAYWVPPTGALQQGDGERCDEGVKPGTRYGRSASSLLFLVTIHDELWFKVTEEGKEERKREEKGKKGRIGSK